MAVVRLKLLPRARRLRSSRTLYTQLDDYQQEAVEFALDVQTAALFFEQGTGKTWICGGIIERLMSPAFTGLLVVSLANLESTWLDFLTAHFPELTVCRDWDAFKAAPAPKLLLMHYEGIKRKKLVEKIRRKRFTFIGYDESQRVKNRSSIDSRVAAKLRDSADYKVILTGTPMDENPAELWPQFRFLRPEIFGTSWKEWADEYLEPLDPDLEKRFGNAKPGTFRFQMIMREMSIAEGKREFIEAKMPQFLEAIRPYSMRVTKDILNLPKLHAHRTPVVLRGVQRRVYREVSRDMITRLGVNRARLTAPLRVTQLGRLQQICGGYVPDDEGNIHEVGRAKLRKAMAIIRRNRGKPIVIFCRFLEEVWSLHDELHHELNVRDRRGLRIETLTGKTKKKLRPQLLRDFQAGNVDILICQIKTGGVGIDLFRATVAIFYSITYSFIDFEQAVARLHRRGQKFEVHLYLLFARDTVDEDIMSAILQKRKITSRVLTQLETRRSQNG